MTNINCLEGIKCPACANEDRFFIAATIIADVTDGGADIASPMHGIGFEWGDESYARCPECEKEGILRDFLAIVQPEAHGIAGQPPHIIRSTQSPTDFWSNDTGWGCLAAATRFHAGEIATLDLPIGGSWVKLKPYSVLLLYPDHANDGGTETYYAFVEAPDAIEAVTVAQRQATAANDCTDIEPEDFAPLLVTAGHHHGQPLFNR